VSAQKLGNYFVLTVLLTVFSAAALAQEASVADLVVAGNNYLGQGDCFTAILTFNMVLEREPGNVDAHLGRGRALFCEGAVARAAEEFRQVISSDPDNMSGYVMLARMYLEQYQSSPSESAGRLDDAIAILNDAERIDRSYPPLYNMRGLIQLERADLEGARSSFETAIELSSGQDVPNSEQAQYHIHAGVVYRELGQPEQALTSFRRAITLNPTSAAARNYLGSALKQLDRCDESIFELRQAVSLSQNFVDANANLGVALFDCGEEAEAERWLRRAVELNPVAYPGLYTYLARAYLSQGRHDEAIDNASRAALLPPSSAEAWYWLGQAYQARGGANDASNARDAYQNALERDPGYALAQEALNSLP
jgi:tetratricopeptide (TPR) repeat protein